MKKLILLSLFFPICILSKYSIVFVHIGKSLPEYVPYSLSQARLFNPNADIYLIGSHVAIKHLPSFLKNKNITSIPFENINITIEHAMYHVRKKYKNGLAGYSSERFFYLHDLIKQLSLENVFHLENDNLLYANLEEMLPTFQKNYPKLGVTLDNDHRCIPGFVWIKDINAIKVLTHGFLKYCDTSLLDMQIIANIYKEKKAYDDILTLPIVMSDYRKFHNLVTQTHSWPKDPDIYSLNQNKFNAIFDAAAIGQFVDGTDSIIKKIGPGFINESCVFNPSFFNIEWIEDEKGRKIPYAYFNDKLYMIVNLHIHSKNLEKFSSVEEL